MLGQVCWWGRWLGMILFSWSLWALNLRRVVKVEVTWVLVLNRTVSLVQHVVLQLGSRLAHNLASRVVSWRLDSTDGLSGLILGLSLRRRLLRSRFFEVFLFFLDIQMSCTNRSWPSLTIDWSGTLVWTLVLLGAAPTINTSGVLVVHVDPT